MNYDIAFVNKTGFHGGNPLNSGWLKMPEISIIRMGYCFDNPVIILSRNELTLKKTTEHLLLEGFEAYNHVVEHRNVIQGKKVNYYHLLLMAKKKDKVWILRYNSFSQLAVYESFDFGKELNGRQSCSGWHEGIEKGKCSISWV